MTPDPTDINRRLNAALSGVAATFRGMTAHRDEYNCDCHWGSAEELALLKTPDVPLDDDLLRRTYWTTDWRHPGPLLRRILPQLSRALVAGEVSPTYGFETLGRMFTDGRWQEWPGEQRAAVREFLDAWWRHVLVAPDAAVAPHQALILVVEVSGELTPWLADWAELLTHPAAQDRFVTAVDEWTYDLLGDTLPWSSWHDGQEDAWCGALSLWVLRYAPAVLREHGAPTELSDDVQRLALPAADRWPAA